MRRLDIKEHDIYKYAIILIYIPNNNNKVILIRYKIYIVNNLFVKTLIDINIIKFKIIILNINKDLVTIRSCNLF